MAFKENTKVDIHTRLMMAYEQIPMWWFHVILVVNIVLIIFVCEYYKYELQLRWWGVLLACAIAITYTLPIGIIYATTNQVTSLTSNTLNQVPLQLTNCICSASYLVIYLPLNSLLWRTATRSKYNHRVYHRVSLSRLPCC